MASKLVIGNTVKVPLEFTLNDGKGGKKFAFSLICDRLPQEEIDAQVSVTCTDFLQRVVHDWSDQRLVVDDEGAPVEFSSENLGVMLSVVDLPQLIVKAYRNECAAKSKN